MNKVTSHRKAETLATSELRYRRLFETAQDGILLVDFKTGMILDVNKFLIDLLGYSKKDFLHKHLWEVGVFKNVAASKKNFKTLQSKRYVRFEDLPLETKKGKPIEVEFVANAYAVGNEIIIQCNIRDITATQEARHALNISELRYRRLFEAAKDGILILSPDTGEITDSNPFIEKLIGYSKKELIGKKLFELSPFKDIVHNKRKFLELQKKKYVRYDHLPLRNKKGKEVFVEFVSNAYSVGDEDVIQCNIRDIAYRKKLQDTLLNEKTIIEKQVIERTKQLEESEEKFEKIFDFSQAAFIVIDKQDNIVDVNAVAGRLFGYTKQFLVGKSIFRLHGRVDKKTRDTCESNLDAARRGRVVTCTCDYITKDGKVMHADTRLSKIHAGNQDLVLLSILDVTEKRESQERYKALYYYSKDAIMILEPPQWSFTSGNPAALAMFDCKNDKEFTALRPWDVSPAVQPDGQKSAHKAKVMIARAIKEGSNYFEWTHRKRNGKDFPATVLLSRIQQEGEDFLIATVRDISSEKKAQEDMAKQLILLNSLIDSSQDMIFIKDTNLRTILCNKAYSRAVKKTPGQMYGHTDIENGWSPELVKGNPAKGIKGFESDDKDALSGKVVHNISDPANVGDDIVVFDTIKLPLKNNQGKIMGVLGIARNVSDHYRLERALESIRAAKEKTILSSIGDGVIATDADGKIILFNHVASEITGFSSNEAIGRDYHTVLHLVIEGGGAPAIDYIERAIKGGKTTSMVNHTLLVRKDGKKIAVADSAAPFFDAQGKIAGCVVVFRDATREREIDRAKTEFVSLASHQLRTPLASINWLGEMLLSGDFGEITKKQEQCVEMLHKSSLHMVNLISALLNVSRLELGTFSINPTPTKLSSMADELLQELHRQMKNKEITITTQYPPNELLLNVDVNLMRIVLQNLLANAVRYAFPRTSITLKIEQDAQKCLIVVSNIGIGIPQKEQSKIFTKLFRASNAQLMEADGTGLGLYIVKSILDATGGKIWFDSITGGSTDFFVELPMKGMIARKGNKAFDIL